MSMRLVAIVLPLACLCWAAQAEQGECKKDCIEQPEEHADHDAASLLQTAVKQGRVANVAQEQVLSQSPRPQAPSSPGPDSQELAESQVAKAVSDKKQNVETGDSLYPYSSRGVNPQTSSYTDTVAPTDFSKNNAKVLWDNPQDEEIRHSPLIDGEKYIYITSTTHIRKLDSKGKMLWDYFVPVEDGMMTTSPTLHDGFVIAMSCVGTPPSSVLSTFSINMKTGKVQWKTKHAGVGKSGDSQGILAVNGTVVFPSWLDPAKQGSDSLLALKASDGSKLWEYKTDDVFWNFKPASPLDGSIIFSSSCGAVHRIGLDGKVIWKTPALSHAPSGGFCSMGGGAVGPNGVFYAEHGTHVEENGKREGIAHINAYSIKDGKHLWKQKFNLFGGQYPAVGYLHGRLAVVAPIGHGLKVTLDGGHLGSNKANWLKNAVVAMDAETGDVIWRHEEKPWPFATAAGDFGLPFLKRTAAKLLDPRQEVICLPDPQGIPLISGDGHVYVSNSQNGDLSAVKDVNKDGKITPDEVSTFQTKVGFLNQPSLAAGMLVAAPCWGPVYIFQQ